MDNKETIEKIKESSKKKQILSILLVVFIIILLLAIIFSIKAIRNKEKKELLFDNKSVTSVKDNQLSKKEKDFIGIKDAQPAKEEEKTYTDNYKKYLDLSEEQKKKQQVIPRKEEIPVTKIEDIKKTEKTDSQIPSSFNLKDKIKLKVSNQGDLGLCWDFASIKTLETYLALHENKDYDLSEIHLDYIMSNQNYGYRDIHSGGNFWDFKDYLKISGPVLEKTLEYREYSEQENEKILALEPVVTVTKTVEFPSSDGLSEKEKQEFRNIVKNHIMTNGALYTVVASPDVETDYFNEKTKSEYFSSNSNFSDRMFHSVAIVGWDDNYSKNNFKGEKPKNNGAYIALNSWGEEWGNNGYFYISYEDMWVENELSGILSTSLKDSLKVNSIKSDSIKKFLDENYGHYYINIEGEDYLTDLVIEGITSIKIENSNLTSEEVKEMIELFPNIDEFYLANNKITDVSVFQNSKNSIIYIDLSNNGISDIYDLRLINELYEINLSGNRISDIDTVNYMNELYTVDLSNNPIDWEHTKFSPGNLSELILVKTNLKDINVFRSLDNLSSLDISNNPIENIEDIKNIKVDLLKMANCNIEDITVFNKLEIYSLELMNNKITDISKFNNSNVDYIDLSNNIGITGLASLSKINSVILSKNNINNLEEIINLTEVYNLDLSYNNLENLTELNELENLYNLSLEGNKNIKVETIPNKIEILNVKNCNLKETTDFSNFNNLYMINISDNPNFKNLKSLYKDRNESNYIYMIINGYDLSVEEIQALDKVEGALISEATIKLGYDVPNIQNQTISIEYGSWLNRFLLRNMLSGKFITKDLRVKKTANNMTIIGYNPKINTNDYDIIIGN